MNKLSTKTPALNINTVTQQTTFTRSSHTGVSNMNYQPVKMTLFQTGIKIGIGAATIRQTLS